jgi:hypothetical protein
MSSLQIFAWQMLLRSGNSAIFDVFLMHSFLDTLGSECYLAGWEGRRSFQMLPSALPTCHRRREVA